LRSRARWFIVAILALLFVSWSLTYYEAASENQRVFLSPTAFHRLEWVSTNLKFSVIPIFIFNHLDQSAGGWADLYDNWVSAIVGRHLSYLGQVGYLVQLQQTPFSSLVSREHSLTFIREIQDSGIANRTSLLEHPIVLIEDFYNPLPLPTYVSNSFYSVSDGVFLGNDTSLATLESVTLPMYSSTINTIGPWNSTLRSWTQTKVALETKVYSHPTDIEATMLLDAWTSASYTIGLRYWDGSGSGLSVIVDGVAIRQISYNASNSPAYNLTSIGLAAGVHTLTIKIIQNPNVQQYASLDYLVVTKT